MIPQSIGDDADGFRPERMLDENFQKFPPGAWKPFGNGKRGCIGRSFAWQEALLVFILHFPHLILRANIMGRPDYDYDPTKLYFRLG